MIIFRSGNVKKRYVFFSLLLFGFLLVVASTAYAENLTVCQNITLSDVYVLINNVTANESCFTVETNNVEIDCAGHQITYSSNGLANETGIFVKEGVNGTIIKNCVVHDGNTSSLNNGRYALDIVKNTYLTINNVSVRVNNSAAIRLTSSQYCLLENSSLLSQNNNSIVLLNTSNSTLYNNVFVSEANEGTHLFLDEYSSFNYVYRNNFTQIQGLYINNSNQNNFFNKTTELYSEGNFYFNISSINITDANWDGWGDAGSDYPVNNTWSFWSGYGADYAPGQTTLGPNTLPVISSVALTSSSAHNFTESNLSVDFIANDTTHDILSNFTDWRFNQRSIAVLNMPFNYNVSSASANAIDDYSTFQHNGTLGGGVLLAAPTWNASGKIGGAYSFDGDDYIEISDNDNLSFTNGSADTPFSISAWIYMHDAVNFKIVAKGEYGSTAEYYFRVGDQVSNTESLILRLYDESNASAIGRRYSASMSAYEDQWVHVVATYNGSGDAAGIALYINGSRVDDLDYNYNADYVAMENLGGDVHIGRYTSYYANGSIDEVKIYNRSLSPEHITQEYLAGASGHATTFLAHNETTQEGNWSALVGVCDGLSCATNITTTLPLTSPTHLLYDCQTIGQKGTYILQNSINSTGTCLTITTDDVVIDGNGFNISYANESSGYAFRIANQQNITIKNVTAFRGDETNDASHTLYASLATDIHIHNATFLENLDGDSSDVYSIYLEDSSEVFLNDSNVSMLYLDTVSDSLFTNNYVHVSKGSYNAIVEAEYADNNNFTSNLFLRGEQNANNYLNLFASDNNRFENNNWTTSSTSTSSGLDSTFSFSGSTQNIFVNENITTRTQPLSIISLNSENLNHTFINVTIEGKKFWYNYSLSDQTIMSNQDHTDIGFFACADCDNVAIENATFYEHGLTLIESNNVLVNNVNITGNKSTLFYTYSYNGYYKGYNNTYTNLYINLSETSSYPNKYAMRLSDHDSTLTNISVYSDSIGVGLLGTGTNIFLSSIDVNASGASTGIYSVNHSLQDSALLSRNNYGLIIGPGAENFSAYDSEITSNNQNVYFNWAGDGDAYFYNVTYATTSFAGSDDSELYDYHYVDVNVTNTTGMLAGATVTATDEVTSTLRDTQTSDGNTVTRLTALKQMINSTHVINYNNYTINATRVNYFANWTKVNVTNSSVYTGLVNAISLILFVNNSSPAEDPSDDAPSGEDDGPSSSPSAVPIPSDEVLVENETVNNISLVTYTVSYKNNISEEGVATFILLNKTTNSSNTSLVFFKVVPQHPINQSASNIMISFPTQLLSDETLNFSSYEFFLQHPLHNESALPAAYYLKENNTYVMFNTTFLGTFLFRPAEQRLQEQLPTNSSPTQRFVLASSTSPIKKEFTPFIIGILAILALLLGGVFLVPAKRLFFKIIILLLFLLLFGSIMQLPFLPPLLHLQWCDCELSFSLAEYIEDIVFLQEEYVLDYELFVYDPIGFYSAIEYCVQDASCSALLYHSEVT